MAIKLVANTIPSRPTTVSWNLPGKEKSYRPALSGCKGSAETPLRCGQHDPADELQCRKNLPGFKPTTLLCYPAVRAAQMFTRFFAEMRNSRLIPPIYR